VTVCYSLNFLSFLVFLYAFVPYVKHVKRYVIKVVDLFFTCFAGSKVKLHDLVPNTSYVFEVKAKNDVGPGNFISVPVATLPPRKSTPCP